ncbi:hypothetical protein BC938DRAFT_472587 [Jimgerdemannia flammicorona]|uniref:Uncharacterized protein n=1 Tax=Jimgerdemannia flammicorona TaxID=994334 RepID=A0A433Q5T0_9FUNG|nr:hypothetical protein BC938DRAFT_472587 [Jimgerdemannia flammicorona]
MGISQIRLAVYSNAQTVLLDDCLSAVDSHTAKVFIKNTLRLRLFIGQGLIQVHQPQSLPLPHIPHPTPHTAPRGPLPSGFPAQRPHADPCDALRVALCIGGVVRCGGGLRPDHWQGHANRSVAEERGHAQPAPARRAE